MLVVQVYLSDDGSTLTSCSTECEEKKKLTLLFVRAFKHKYTMSARLQSKCCSDLFLEKFFHPGEANNDMNPEGVTITEQTPTLPEYKRL